MTDAYDAITIGSGLGGLTAAALYARAGHRVLVLERNAEFGGAATTYRHGPLTIEASLEETASLSDPVDPKARILRALGILDDLEFVPVGAERGRWPGCSGRSDRPTCILPSILTRPLAELPQVFPQTDVCIWLAVHLQPIRQRHEKAIAEPDGKHWRHVRVAGATTPVLDTGQQSHAVDHPPPRHRVEQVPVDETGHPARRVKSQRGAWPTDARHRGVSTRHLMHNCLVSNSMLCSSDVRDQTGLGEKRHCESQ
jgi:hypothetical protein